MVYDRLQIERVEHSAAQHEESVLREFDISRMIECKRADGINDYHV